MKFTLKSKTVADAKKDCCTEASKVSGQKTGSCSSTDSCSPCRSQACETRCVSETKSKSIKSAKMNTPYFYLSVYKYNCRNQHQQLSPNFKVRNILNISIYKSFWESNLSLLLQWMNYCIYYMQCAKCLRLDIAVKNSIFGI
ncbi:hypothetical protein HNY73_017020 [Argiope bruennichi]|uniref:Uncharacterized protein n=1 Tax=Argiope bruennichi TaxID=94029 RepID=A0A8T0EKA0_ARGBR|nr:hypothetical protein HNY73_017020 [Argiope bruennichi]